MEKKWLNNKTFLCIMSLVISVFVWFFVVTTQDPQRTEKVSGVEVICGLNQYQLNEGLSIVSKSGEEVSFLATGRRSFVTGVRGSYYAKLNLDNITQPGKYNITPSISTPDGVYISNVNPSVIEVYIDKNVTSLVPVDIKTENSLPEGLIIKDIESSIKQLSVTMPSLGLEQIAYAGVTVDLSEITESSKLNCEVKLYDINNEPIEIKGAIIDYKTVTVDITVEKHASLPVKPMVYVGGALYDNIQFAPKTIDVYGDISAFEGISEIETQPLYFEEAPPAGYEHSAFLSVQTGLYLKENENGEIKITFK